MDSIDRKIESVRRVEDFQEKKKYDTTKKIFQDYMKGMNQKLKKPMLRIAQVMIPFDIGGITTAAVGSTLGEISNELTLNEALEIVGKVGAVEVGATLGLVIATVAAANAREGIRFVNDYISYPKNKEQLELFGLYYKYEEKQRRMNSFPEHKEGVRK